MRFGSVVVLSLAFLSHSLFAGPDDEEGSISVSQTLFEPDFDFLLPGEESQGVPTFCRLPGGYESDEEFLNSAKRQQQKDVSSSTLITVDGISLEPETDNINFLSLDDESLWVPMLKRHSPECYESNEAPLHPPKRFKKTPETEIPSSPVTPLREIQKFVAASPTALQTPTGAAKKVFRPVRESVAKSLEAQFNGDLQSPSMINSPTKLKSVFRDTFPINHFTHSGVFDGVPYYLDSRLFDPQQAVICVRELSVTVETNLERMRRGCSPYSYKVTPTVEQYLNQPIMVGNPDFPWGVNYLAMLNRQQNHHRMDIHHLAKTMGDGVTPLPSDFHHGTDFGIVVKDGKVLAYGVSRKNSRPFLKEDAKYFADCLHPDFGDSKIDRKAFGKWRKAFWKHVAGLIVREKENGTYNPFSPVVPKIQIFPIRTEEV